MSKAVYKNLEAEIKRNDINKGALAKMLGFSRWALYDRLTGVTPFTFDETQAIRAYIECKSGKHLELDYLFERT